MFFLNRLAHFLFPVVFTAPLTHILTIVISLPTFSNFENSGQLNSGKVYLSWIHSKLGFFLILLSNGSEFNRTVLFCCFVENIGHPLRIFINHRFWSDGVYNKKDLSFLLSSHYFRLPRWKSGRSFWIFNIYSRPMVNYVREWIERWNLTIKPPFSPSNFFYWLCE